MCNISVAEERLYSATPQPYCAVTEAQFIVTDANARVGKY